MQLDFFIPTDSENNGTDFSLNGGIAVTTKTNPSNDSLPLKTRRGTIVAPKPITNSSLKDRPNSGTSREAKPSISTDIATAPTLNSNGTTTFSDRPAPSSIADSTSSSAALSQLLQKLSDRELDQVTRLKARQEQETTLDLLLHLKAIEARRVYSLLAYSSMWDYCVKGLGYSESAASERVAAMRLLRQNPKTEGKLRSGQLNLATAAQLHRFFQTEAKSGIAVTPEYKSTLIEQAAGHSKREVEKLLLTESFKNRGYSTAGSADNADEIKVIPLTSSSNNSTTTKDTCTDIFNSLDTVNNVGISKRTGTSTNLDNTRSLPKIFKETTRLVTPELTELKLYADGELMALLTRIKELRGPQQSHAELFKAAIRVYLEKKDPLCKKLRKQPAKNKSEKVITSPLTESKHFIKRSAAVQKNSTSKIDLGTQACNSALSIYSMPSTLNEAGFTSNSDERVRNNNARHLRDGTTVCALSTTDKVDTPNAAGKAPGNITKCTQTNAGKTSKSVTVNQPRPAVDADNISNKKTLTTNPNAAGEPLSKTATRSRYIPATIRQQLFARSNGQCEYRDPETDQNCQCKTRLEIEHTLPFAGGGRHTLSNLKVYCPSHNQQAALRIFGEQKMARHWRNECVS